MSKRRAIDKIFWKYFQMEVPENNLVVCNKRLKNDLVIPLLETA